MSGFIAPPVNGAAHKVATSTGVANVANIAKVEGSTAMIVCAKTNNARCTFDGEAPAVGGPGLIIVAGAQPVILPFASNISFCSEIAASSELDVLYLS